MNEEEAFVAMIARWRGDSKAFVRECFGVTLDPFQEQVLDWYDAGEPRIAMQACKGPGKTALLAWISLHFILCYPFSNSAVISTSGANARSNFWKELATWRSKSELLSRVLAMTATKLYPKDDSGEDKKLEFEWYCEMRTWSKTADDAAIAQTLQGLHRDHVMVLMDESGGLPDGLMVAAEGIFANRVAGDGKRVYLIQAGNPTVLKGPLYRAATTERSQWKVIEITGDPADPKRCTRISLEWAEKQIKLYGRDHPWVLVNVMGRFPPASFNAIISLADITACIGRHLADSQFKTAAKIIGVDVARFGDDETVIFLRQGIASFLPYAMRHAHPDDVAGHVATIYEDWQADAVMVDATGGYGDGVVDALARIGITAIRVQFAGKPIDAKFYNKRAEILWKTAQWIKNGCAIAAGEAADRLVEELTIIEYTYRGDKILIDEKDQIKDKLGRSPDYSDALACTFAFPVQAKSRDPLAGVTGSYHQAITDYDPLERP